MHFRSYHTFLDSSFFAVRDIRTYVRKVRTAQKKFTPQIPRSTCGLFRLVQAHFNKDYCDHKVNDQEYHINEKALQNKNDEYLMKDLPDSLVLE